MLKPRPSAPKPGKEPPPPEWDQFKGKLGIAFAQLVKQRASVAAQIKELEAEEDEYKVEILKAMKRIPESSVMVEGIRVTYQTQIRKSLDAGILSDQMLRPGLDSDQVNLIIEAATKETPSEFTRITPPRE